MDARVEAAEAAFHVQNYPRVITLLEPLTGDAHRDFQQEPRYLQVLEWLGASQWLTGARDEALSDTFTELLVRWPRHALDELTYPSELVADFQRQREFLARYGVIDPFGMEDDGTVNIIVRDVEVSDVPVIAYFAPFGVGQFANGEDGKGTAIAILQGLGIATTAATWLAVASLTDDRGRVSPDDEGTATAMRALWYAGAIMFTGSYAYSVTDGLLNRDTRPTVRYRRDRIDKDQLPDEVLSPTQAGFGAAPTPGGATATFFHTF